MEAGSLLQEALQRQSEQHDLLDQALWLDLHILGNTTPSIPHSLQLAQVASQVNQFFQSQNYLWHIGGDGPVFGIHSTNGIPHLRAVCRYGANVADEWAAIEWIRQYTSCRPDLVVECWDVKDGQILLIESSDSLPVWVDQIGPEACRHRCWIRQGKIHLVAPKTSISQCALELNQALEVLKEGQTDSNVVETPHRIQQVIQNCIHRAVPIAGSSTQNNLSNQHKAVLAVPRPVALLIQIRPDLVNAAIVAFASYALYPKKKTSKAPQSTATSTIACEDWVWTTHSFTRTNYAMIRTLVSPAWKTENYIPKDYQSVELRRLQRQCAVEATPHLHYAVQVGVRVVAGFNELLQRQSPTLSSLKERRVLQYWPRLLQEDLGLSAQWLVEAWQAGPNHAVHNLENVLQCPVLREELPLDNITPLSHPETSVSKQIQQILQKEARHVFVVPRQEDVDANEEWMILSNDTMEEQMKSMRDSGSNNRQRQEEEQVAQLDTMLESFQTFMVDKSGPEGVSHPTDEVSINPRVFLNLLQKVLDPSTSPEDINFSTDDNFFDSEDYDAMMPDDEDEDENLPLDSHVVELMAAMDEELKGTAAAAVIGDMDVLAGTAGVPMHHEEGASKEGLILTNLLQSLDAGSGGPGPVQSMMKAMGKEPPQVSTTPEEEE